MGIDPISIGIVAAGALLSTGAQVMSAQGAQKSMQARQRQADLEMQQQKLQQVRQARIARANIVEAGANEAGAGGENSAATGGAMSVNAAAEHNIQYTGDQQNLTDAIYHGYGMQRNAAGLSDIGGGLEGVGKTLFNNSDYIKQKGSIFG